jgi:hypothetical protein
MMVWGESIVRENPMVNRFIPFKPTVSGNDQGRPALNERSLASAAKPKLLDHVRHAIRARHDSRRTEEVYVMWIKRFIFFHSVRHPAEMGEPEINRFLTDLAANKKVSASTQNQALSALLFLYQHVLNRGGRGVRSPADLL